MTQEERQHWDRKYRHGSHASQEPDPLLPNAYEEFIQPLFPAGGTALDVAGGAGRHAIWVAQHGWHVTLVDLSEVGVAKARENAGELAGRIDFQVRDLTNSTLGPAQYDLVMVFFYLERTINAEVMQAVRPGGLLVYKTYTSRTPQFGQGPTHPEYLLEENELLQAFSGMTVLHYQETLRDRGIAELVARKKA
ncbi:MAG: class I SAM-dependent methyltransferase [Acidobacteriia bacterium]|nr:class I SAM-dependent methyltransferase [Terriglobia bacterium]